MERLPGNTKNRLFTRSWTARVRLVNPWADIYSLLRRVFKFRVYIHVHIYICIYREYTYIYICVQRMFREVGAWGRVPLERWRAGVEYHFQEIS